METQKVYCCDCTYFWWSRFNPASDGCSSPSNIKSSQDTYAY